MDLGRDRLKVFDLSGAVESVGPVPVGVALSMHHRSWDDAIPDDIDTPSMAVVF